ncbi:MAG: NAD-dependent epimerase/dehydratase family protein [Coriobacteriia bacterium]|nr:NAD-dependent epimerase/dehydratase family protein [Coriobacteriia bacterium]
MKVLVTGGAGFIGSNTVFALLAAGHDVLVIDDLSTGHMGNLDPRASFRKLDILDDETRVVIAEFAPEGVVHLAAQASVSVSVAQPERDRAVNAEGTRRIAVAARDAGARVMVSASTAAVYGEPEMVPLIETARKAPMSPYGSSKLEAEGLMATELRGSGTDFASFRFANVYGPRQDAAGEGGVVAIFCDRMHRSERPVLFGDGSQTRDFVFVGDVVAAIIAALSAAAPLAAEGPDGPAYNVGTGERTSVNQLLMSMRVAAGYFGPSDTASSREGDILHSALSPSKAQAALGWRAGVELETGLAMTWRWFAAQG